MVGEPKDLIGKWFSNVGGIPDEYWYILDAEWHPQEVMPKPTNVLVKAVLIRRNRISVRDQGLSGLNVFGSPLTKRTTPELNYTIHKCIRYLFEKEIKR